MAINTHVRDVLQVMELLMDSAQAVIGILIVLIVMEIDIHVRDVLQVMELLMDSVQAVIGILIV